MFRTPVAILALSFCATVALNAQNRTASVVGLITDPSGGVIAAARLDIRNVETNDLRQVNYDAKGEFAVTNLNVIASGVAGPAVSYALGQGATLVAAIWVSPNGKNFETLRPA